jgi:hypothetical protein
VKIWVSQDDCKDAADEPLSTGAVRARAPIASNAVINLIIDSVLLSVAIMKRQVGPPNIDHDQTVTPRLFTMFPLNRQLPCPAPIQATTNLS